MKKVKIYDKEYPYVTEGELFYQIGATAIREYQPKNEFEWVELFTYVSLAAGALSQGVEFKIKFEDIEYIFSDDTGLAEFFMRLAIDTDLRRRLN